MKKIVLFAFAISIIAVSCKKEEKTETPTETQEKVSGLMIVNDSTKVNWTAYKTTEKVAVGGSFTEITLKETKKGNTPEEVLEGVSFSIPVSSLFTNNPDRDYKLKSIFFGALKEKELLSGVLNFRDNKTFLTISINDMVKQIEVASNYSGKKFTLEGKIDLVDFGAENAIEAINTACYDLHKGSDGISKTWSEVALKGSVLFE
ncbi:hypothetical protein GFJ94_07315 [Flavobacterium sp. LMO8]|uniref:YceI family protein n=1 Tax=Flavobacterium sp. LMO8 TaxID=2654244 RepID=UPI00129284A3|nr:YceI family protein [Flavobacterium sp. LMO8]MQP24872.1 hypothetical protein [Flavobacterium sp. LMO8]